jgi:hypothetical protein
MGSYINPPDCTKENWLAKHGQEIFPDMDDSVIEIEYENDVPSRFPVCLVDNLFFTAAAIGFNAKEIHTFLQPDGRKKRWFMVGYEDLKPVSDIENFKDLM